MWWSGELNGSVSFPGIDIIIEYVSLIAILKNCRHFFG